MQFDSSLNADRPVDALLGNGELATTLGRTGYHDGGQEFLLAGRRHAGPEHQLISFGRLIRHITVDGEEPDEVDWRQSIHTDIGEVRTRLLYNGILESTRSLVLFHRNCFVAETRITSQSTDELLVRFELAFESDFHGSGSVLSWGVGDNLGVITLAADGTGWSVEKGVAKLVREERLQPGDEISVHAIISFSDRLAYQEPVLPEGLEPEMHRHAEKWRDFWGTSDIVTGDDAVDSFREIALYTLACQATPWSVPPTLTKRHWDGGAFHDEYYPFRALMAGGWTEMARRIPYFRLATLPEAITRARGEGALYPWSSTEDGKERDPHGHWYTERFHLGQIGACIWSYWLYERDVDSLEELYPVLKGCADYFERNMVERDPKGKLKTKPCTDFDESAGEVSGGPFTMAAAVYLLDRASEASRRLAVHRGRAVAYETAAKELRHNFGIDMEERRYCVSGAKDQHSSILGYVVPFFLDEGSEFARNSLEFIHDACRTDLGWKPGLHASFDGSTWMWTAGHLGMCHSVVGDGDRAWEAVRLGPVSAGRFMSPNEHLSKAGASVVPWFTTGCGAWLTALHWMFARVDDSGDHVLPAVPASLADFQVRGLRLSRGVSVALRCQQGKLIFLALTAREALTFSFEGPIRYLEGAWPRGSGRIVDLGDRWRIQVELAEGENVFIG